jgi:hypothetical protein
MSSREGDRTRQSSHRTNAGIRSVELSRKGFVSIDSFLQLAQGDRSG